MHPDSTHLWLVRHGEPVHDEAGPDPKLSERGREQARRVARRVRALQVDAVLSSPLRRAHETAEEIVAITGHDEIGVLEGLSEADRYAPGAYVRMEELRRDKERFARFMRDPLEFMGVEHGVFQSAVDGAFAQILERHRGQRVAAVSHGLVLNSLLARILDLKRITFFAPHYASVSRFLHDPDVGWGVVSVNDVGHHELPGEP